jgi:hypothetical protein
VGSWYGRHIATAVGDAATAAVAATRYVEELVADSELTASQRMLCHPYRQSIMTDERESCAVVAGYLARGDRAELAWPGEPLLTTPEGLADRYRGSLLWGAVGDALGRAVEGRSPATIRDQFGEQGLREYVKWHGWQSGPTGTITDDTQLTIEVARSLLSTDGQLDPDDLVGRLIAFRADAGSAARRGPQLKIWNTECRGGGLGPNWIQQATGQPCARPRSASCTRSTGHLAVCDAMPPCPPYRLTAIV